MMEEKKRRRGGGRRRRNPYLDLIHIFNFFFFKETEETEFNVPFTYLEFDRTFV